MQLIPMSKLFAAIAITVGALSSYPSVAYAHKDSSHIDKRIDYLERRVSLLEADEVTYGPIAVRDIHFNHARHFVSVAPGQTIECSFKYKLDSSQQEFLSKNHLIVGLKDVAAETCATHLYGVWDSSGKAEYNLVSPLIAPGESKVYEVRIAYLPGDTCEEALSQWNVLGQQPDASATIGYIQVVNP